MLRWCITFVSIVTSVWRASAVCHTLRETDGGRKEWTCEENKARYCECEHKRLCDYMSDDPLSDDDDMYCWQGWRCSVVNEEDCIHGDPSCLWGKCKDVSEACGEQWANAPTDATCETLFGEEKYANECMEVFGSGKICPESVFTHTYRAWADVMLSATKTQDMLRAAALDTAWFYDKLRSMVNTSASDVLESTAYGDLITSQIQRHFVAFRDFSCLRNLPQCINDNRATADCENKCFAVTDAIEQWSLDCARLKASYSNKSIRCLELGYTRDCNGTAGLAAGAWPGLCIAFQNSPARMASVNGGNTVKLRMVLALLLVNSWSVLLFM